MTFKPLARIRPIDKLANANAIRREIGSYEPEPPTPHDDASHTDAPLAWDDSNLPSLRARLPRQHEADFRAPGCIPLTKAGQP